MNLRQRLRVALLLLLGTMAVSITGYMVFGGSKVSFVDALYMAVITVAGVGYGEIIPTENNAPLRIFNMFVVVVGVTIMVYVFSVVTAFLVEGEIRNLFWRRKMQKKISELKDHYVVCGLADTGRYVAEELHRTATPFVVVEAHEEAVQKFIEQAGDRFREMLYIVGDATDEAVLDQAGVERARGLIAGMPSDKDNLVTTVMARQKNARLRIVARCGDVNFSERMIKAGANSTVSPNHIGGMRLASEVLRPHVVGFLDIMLKDHSRTLRIEEVEVPEQSPWKGARISELDLRHRYNLLVLATKREHGRGQEAQFHPNPPDDQVVEGGSVIIVMGDVADVRRARHDAHAQKHALTGKG